MHIQRLEALLNSSSSSAGNSDLSEKEEHLTRARLEKRTRRSERQDRLIRLQKEIEMGVAKDPCYPHRDFVTVGDDGRLGNQISGYASLVGLAQCLKMKMVISQVKILWNSV